VEYKTRIIREAVEREVEFGERRRKVVSFLSALILL